MTAEDHGGPFCMRKHTNLPMTPPSVNSPKMKSHCKIHRNTGAKLAHYANDLVFKNEDNVPSDYSCHVAYVLPGRKLMLNHLTATFHSTT